MKRLENLQEFSEMLSDQEISKFLRISENMGKSDFSAEMIEFLLELQETHDFIITESTFGGWYGMAAKIKQVMRDKAISRLGI